jgi:hypothetical protein
MEDEMCSACGKSRRGQHWWERKKGKRPLGRPKRIWVYKIKMDIGEIGCSDLD